MQQLDWVLLISRWLHLLAATAAIGGAAFMRLALAPGAKAVLDDENHRKLREAVRSRWAIVVGVCIGILLLTGGLNFALLAIPPKIDPLPYHPIFGVKFVAALAVFFLASALVGRSPGFDKMRNEQRKWLSVILALAALIVLLSGVLGQVRSTKVAKTVDTTSKP
jgi:hypothetical protein